MFAATPATLTRATDLPVDLDDPDADMTPGLLRTMVVSQARAEIDGFDRCAAKVISLGTWPRARLIASHLTRRTVEERIEVDAETPAELQLLLAKACGLTPDPYSAEIDPVRGHGTTLQFPP